MSMTSSVGRDERTVAVENAGYGWAYGFLSFALLIDVVCRGVFRHEDAWDLLALVIVAGAVSTIHNIRRKIWTRRSTRDAVFVFLVAVVFGAVFVVVGAITGWFGS